MGRVASTNSAYSQSTQTIKCGTKCLSICVSSWQFWLQSDAPGTDGLCSAVSHQTKQTQNIWRTFKRRLVPQDISRALSDTCCVSQSNKSQEIHGHSVFQTQIHNSADSHKSRCNRQCLSETDRGNQWYPTVTRWRTHWSTATHSR